MKIEPQTIATLTRNRGADSTLRVRIDAAGSAGKFSPSDTGKVIYDNSCWRFIMPTLKKYLISAALHCIKMKALILIIIIKNRIRTKAMKSK